MIWFVNALLCLLQGEKRQLSKPRPQSRKYTRHVCTKRETPITPEPAERRHVMSMPRRSKWRRWAAGGWEAPVWLWSCLPTLQEQMDSEYSGQEAVGIWIQEIKGGLTWGQVPVIPDWGGEGKKMVHSRPPWLYSEILSQTQKQQRKADFLAYACNPQVGKWNQADHKFKDIQFETTLGSKPWNVGGNVEGQTESSDVHRSESWRNFKDDEGRNREVE